MAKRYTEEEIKGFMQEAQSSTQSEVARKHGFSVTNFAKWKRKFKPARRKTSAKSNPSPAPSAASQLKVMEGEYTKVVRENAVLRMKLGEVFIERFLESLDD